MLEVKLHDIGEGMTEGEIVNYFVEVGDQVSTDQPLVEVLTDKMTAELPSPCTGTVRKIIVKPGETVQVGTSLIIIEADKEHQIISETITSNNPVAATMDKGIERIVNPFKRVLAAPYTRKIARDNNIDIAEVPAADPSGRVTEEDVYRYIKKSQEINELDEQPVKFKEQTPDEIPFRGIRKEIAKKMMKSLFTIPHVTHFDEVNMTKLFEIREEMNKAGNAVSVPAFFIKALTISLKEFPIFNAELDEENDRILLKKSYHIGFATETKNGLLVPVIHDADKKSIKEIHHDLIELTEKAVTGKLSLAEMQNSTFSMSNVGPLGSTGATPIINYPETALIAFHKTKKRPIVNDQDEIVIGHVMTLSMSFDHRVADGSTAVSFTNRFINLIEHPYQLILEMV
ncbi:2-oxo acid dehydrogenase subunit E2 [Sporosarcina sp. Marseille-Q4063]|uniref:dihydrolipoamide acetyltransferase family protein n=1 Tax=Sporosarcina sp. Marseille-Q4063 TaxID=2810514 RepID=UPI001BAEEE8B|nr:dihydrolipoamide acetyltransferase family protein [Sporosarcina sp. Marseille-Q4063]QUW22030.1 2-oxo acid dehydrogenase subunit E2 [Sporosarcina sp. Marseille-Q4063]